MRLTPQQVFLCGLRRLSGGTRRTDGSHRDLLVPRYYEQGRPGRSLRPSLDLPGRAILLEELRCWGAKLAVSSRFRNPSPNINTLSSNSENGVSATASLRNETLTYR